MVILQQRRETSVNITAMQCMKNWHIGCHRASTVTSLRPLNNELFRWLAKNFCNGHIFILSIHVLLHSMQHATFAVARTKPGKKFRLIWDSNL